VKLPYVSVIFDPAIAKEQQKKGKKAIYGDAMNEPILKKAHVDKAIIIIISVGNSITSMAIIDAVKKINKKAFIIVRTHVISDMEDLYKNGADQVIPEEFETAREMFERVLEQMLIPQRTINKTIANIRENQYGIFLNKEDRQDYSILKELPNIQIIAIKVDKNSMIVGKTLIDINFRNSFGVTIVGIMREQYLIEHPDSNTQFQGGDMVYIMGRPEQINQAQEMFNSMNKNEEGKSHI